MRWPTGRSNRIQREARVGTAINMRYMKPAARLDTRWISRSPGCCTRPINTSFLDTLSEGKLRFALKTARVPEAAGTQDFVGINYYTGDLVSFNPFNPGELFSKRSYPKDADLSATGFLAHWPEGLFESIRLGAQIQPAHPHHRKRSRGPG